MTENVDISFPESTPQTSERILHKVGLSAEQLHGKEILYFGDENSELRLSEASISAFDPDVFIELEMLIPEGKSLDYVLSVNNSYLNGALDTEVKVDLLSESVRVLKETGELRIANPDVDPKWSKEEIEENFAYALYDRALDVSVNYISGTEDHDSYLVINPQI